MCGRLIESVNKTNLSKPTDGDDRNKCLVAVTYAEIDGKKTIQFRDENNIPADFNQSMLELTGTKNVNLATEILAHGALATRSADRGVTADKMLNLSMENLAEAQPQDAIEARLATQMNALYSRGMSYLGRLEHSADIPTLQFFLNSATKLLRLHNESIETLSRYRRKGESKMIVQHVTVNDGGKALVSGALVQGEN